MFHEASKLERSSLTNFDEFFEPIVTFGPTERDTPKSKLARRNESPKTQFIQNLKILLPHIGLTLLLASYVTGGALIFRHIEHDSDIAEQMRQLKMLLRAREAFINQSYTVYSQKFIFSHVKNKPNIFMNSEKEYKTAKFEPTTTRNGIETWRELMTDRLANLALLYREFDQDIVEKSLSTNLSLWYYPDDDNFHNITPCNTGFISKWTFQTALIYSLTIVTTTGYDHIAPRTQLGKLFAVFFGIVGIPLMFITAADLGKFLSDTFVSCLIRYSRSKRRYWRRFSKWFRKFRVNRSKKDCGSAEHAKTILTNEKCNGTLSKNKDVKFATSTTIVLDSDGTGDKGDQNNVKCGNDVNNNIAIIDSNYGEMARGCSPVALATITQSSDSDQAADSINSDVLASPGEPEPCIISASCFITIDDQESLDESVTTGQATENSQGVKPKLDAKPMDNHVSGVTETSATQSVASSDDNDTDDEDTPTPGSLIKLPILAYFLFILTYCAVGAILYRSLESPKDTEGLWTFIHAFHFSFNTITTIGLGNVAVSTVFYQVFVISYIVVGLAVVTMCVDLASSELKVFFSKFHYFGRRNVRAAAEAMASMSDDLREAMWLLAVVRRAKRRATLGEAGAGVVELRGGKAAKHRNRKRRSALRDIDRITIDDIKLYLDSEAADIGDFYRTARPFIPLNIHYIQFADDGSISRNTGSPASYEINFTPGSNSEPGSVQMSDRSFFYSNRENNIHI